ncbi:unnamed protein product [Ceutorhynchus assimilis]|uniref:Beta-galactosidase n=1 Tax=Ceutorhynchus assimilis TaxID=467358 RepID=A0A9N9MXL6_9CUCU|nr:unnamed protein product [Ceutorhynchus assimilis]
MSLVSSYFPLPSIYEHYTNGGVYSGLDSSKPYFTLNGKNITIYSGAMHYFRVPRKYWRDRLRKMRATGLNTVETYVPWNLHEPQQGHYDFGDGDSDMQDFLNITEFLKTAQEEDLLAIVRPGPYICSEFEFGGFPSWLLRYVDIKFRTSEFNYMKFVARYFNILLPILAALQFSKGGPVIAFQVENEYGSTEKLGFFTPDKLYLRKLRKLFIDNGIVELLVTSDSPTAHGSIGTIPEVFLQTANFAANPEIEFLALKRLQPNRPVMAMEFWTGWFDHWGEIHHERDNQDFYNNFERILKYPASVNMYMFHGGSNFGFLNGANLANDRTDNSGYQPDISSYDYDAPLTESGDYTIKYVMVKQLISKYNPVLTRLPKTPSITYKDAYGPANIQRQLVMREIWDQVDFRFYSDVVLPMEYLPINNMSGQSYGYTVYRKKLLGNFYNKKSACNNKALLDIPSNSILTIAGRICDSAIILVDGVLLSKPLERTEDLNGFGFWKQNNSKLNLGSQGRYGATLEIIVENWGRNGFGYVDQFYQLKGLWQGEVFLNNLQISSWEIIPLEFKKSWIKNLSGWHTPKCFQVPGPALHKTNVYVDTPKDTFIDMRKWCKGIVIVNNFVLGRYSKIGPQQTLYLPAPFLEKGLNEVVIFEHYKPYNRVEFLDHPVYLTRSSRMRDIELM